MIPYQPRLGGQPAPHPLGKIVAVGRNYAEHARELGNPVPPHPLLFIKPATAAADMAQALRLPEGLGPCHFELELALLIGHPLRHADAADCRGAIAGIGLALDLTLRDLQQQLKRDGHPWERAKAFDGACPLSEFVPAQDLDPGRLRFRLWRNGQLAQDGDTRDMLVPIDALLADISQALTLLPGDVVLTGTPAGVGALAAGDVLEVELEGLLRLTTRVASAVAESGPRPAPAV